MSINTQVPPVNNTPASTSAAGGQQQINTTYSEFIQMLLVQLKNQDPTNPIDTAQFTQQLVGLSQVQQAVNTNNNLERLIAMTQGSQINNAVGYIGKTVDAIGNKGILVDGHAEFSYSLPATARSATVTISDSAGKVVFSGEGGTKAGKNIVVWNGSSSLNNQTVPPGIYTISVTAKDLGGKNMVATTYTTGPVSSVDIAGGDVMLALGDGTLLVPLDQVLTIRNEGLLPEQQQG